MPLGSRLSKRRLHQPELCPNDAQRRETSRFGAQDAGAKVMKLKSLLSQQVAFAGRPASFRSDRHHDGYFWREVALSE